MLFSRPSRYWGVQSLLSHLSRLASDISLATADGQSPLANCPSMVDCCSIFAFFSLSVLMKLIFRMGSAARKVMVSVIAVVSDATVPTPVQMPMMQRAIKTT